MRLETVSETSAGDKKKFVATFLDDGKIRKVKFGVKGSHSYVDGASKDVRDAYRARHDKEKNGPVDSPGMLSYWITWGDSPSLQVNIREYKRKYRL